MISRISSIQCSHAPAIPTDEGRIYSRIERVMQPCVGIASVKDTYSAYVKDRFENFASHGIKERAKRNKASNSLLLAFSLAFLASRLQRPAQNTRPGFGKDAGLIIIRA